MTPESKPDNVIEINPTQKKKRGRPANTRFDLSDPEILAVINEINERFFLVADRGSHARICWEEPDDLLGGIAFRTQGIWDWKQRYLPDLIPVGAKGNGEPILENKAEVWLQHPARREYERVVFLPGVAQDQIPPDLYNLWRGFRYEPIKGDCGLYLAHLRENVCLNDPIKYDYLIGWMAYAVRHPGEQGHVAIVVQGKKGVGKNVFAEGFSALFGNHAMVVSDQKRVTNNFNAHLENICVLIADEAFYANDRKHEGILKSLITGNELSIEPKGVDPFQVPNLLHLIILGNAPHLVRATRDERRFLVLTCGNQHIQDKPYFRAIVEQLKNGGYEALLYHLLYEVDLTNFDVRSAPHTAELRHQMLHSLNRIESAWHECLETGELPGIVDKGGVWLSTVDFTNWAAKKDGPRWEKITVNAVGDLLRDMGFESKPRGQSRQRYWKLPTLKECREKWDKLHFPLPYAWPECDGWVEVQNFRQPLYGQKQRNKTLYPE